MPQRFKAKFDENGDRCPKNIQKLRRLPECGIFDRDLIPFNPINPPPPPPPTDFKPFEMRGIPDVINPGLIPDMPERPNPRFPTEPGTLVGGATGPGSQFSGARLPQDETNLFQAKAVREIEPRPGYSRLVQTPVEAQSAPLPRQLESVNFRNQEFDNVANTLDDIIQSRVRPVVEPPGPTEAEMNAAIQYAIEETGAIVDDGAGVVPRPRRAPIGDERDTEFGPEPLERPPPRRFKRPTGKLQPRRLAMESVPMGAESAARPNGTTSATISEASGVELQDVLIREPPQPLRQRTPQQRMAGMRNVEEDVLTTPQGTESGEDVRDRPTMSGSKRKGDYFEVEQGSPSRIRANVSRGRVMSQLQNRASQMSRNIELATQATKRARTAMTEAIASRTRGAVQDIQAATVRQFGQGYERVVSDSVGIRRAQIISGERPVGGGRPIPQDVEMANLRQNVATLDDGSITVRRPVTEDVTGLRDIDLDFSPFDEVRDLPTVAGRTTAPKLSFSERIQAARQGVTTRGIAEGAGKAGVGFLAGMGVAQLMGGTDYTGNRFANASIVGGVSGASGDIVARTAGMIGQKAAIKIGATAAEDAAIFTATRAGTALLRGGAEGLGIGIVAAPLDILLNNALVDSGMSHMGANALSSGAVGLGTTATIGAISLAAAPETAGLSILVGLAATAVSSIVGFFTGKAQDDKEQEEKRKQYAAQQKVINTAKARKKLLATLPQHDYDFNKALAAFPNKGGLGVGDDTWSAFSTHSVQLFNARPDNNPPPAPGGGGPQSADQIRLNQLFSKFIQHHLIRQVCAGVGSECDELRSRDTGALTADELKFLNDKTGNTWQPQADMQITMSVQELQYTQVRIKDAQTDMVNLWNNRRKLPNQVDDYTRETAYLDPKFEDKFKNAIKLDAQQQVVNAYYDDQTKLEQLPPNVQTAAGYDPAFKGLMDSFYTDMEDTASNLEVTIPQLIELQGMTGEAQRDKYQEFQFDRVKTQQPVVEQAGELAQEQDAVRAAGFYDIDQAYLETDPTAIGNWHPSDSQILQAHAAGMNLNQYVSYMHQLALGDAGDYSKLPTYTEEQLRQSGMLDYSHFQDELQKAGYRRDLYIYDPVTRLFTPNPNAPGLPDQDEAKSFISQYTPQYLVKARQEYADMIHGLNEKNQAQVDAYNTNLLSDLSAYGKQYNEMVASQNEYLISHAGPVTELLHYHIDDVFNQYRLEYNPLSDSLPTKDKKVVDGNTVSAPNIPGRQLESERDRKKREAAEALGMTSTQYDVMKHNLQNDGYDYRNMTDNIATRYAANAVGMSPSDYQQYKQDVQAGLTSVRKIETGGVQTTPTGAAQTTPKSGAQTTSNLQQNFRKANPNLNPRTTFTDNQIKTLNQGGQVTGSDGQQYASA